MANKFDRKSPLVGAGVRGGRGAEGQLETVMHDEGARSRSVSEPS